MLAWSDPTPAPTPAFREGYYEEGKIHRTLAEA
jgi:hypothetical protein